MKLIKLQMGCLPSRSTVTPTDKDDKSTAAIRGSAGGQRSKLANGRANGSRSPLSSGNGSRNGSRRRSATGNSSSSARRRGLGNSNEQEDSLDRQDEDLFSILMNDEEDEEEQVQRARKGSLRENSQQETTNQRLHIGELEHQPASGQELGAIGGGNADIVELKDNPERVELDDEINNTSRSSRFRYDENDVTDQTKAKGSKLNGTPDLDRSLGPSIHDASERFASQNNNTSMDGNNNNNDTNIDSDINNDNDTDTDRKIDKDEEEESTGELNIDLLRQYVAIDYEIQQLESKNALRVYHEKIEQLEQLEHELDMISSEAEQAVGTRDSTDPEALLLAETVGSPSSAGTNSRQQDPESNSLVSGTGSMSPASWDASRGAQNGRATGVDEINDGNNFQQKVGKTKSRGANGVESTKRNGSQTRSKRSSSESQAKQSRPANGVGSGGSGAANTKMHLYGESPSSIENIFNKKIVLEKERDKLKKEVELVIIECDKLQQKCERRDDILDQLFDGRSGNGLENHLEQQLSWLLEQKHYVDQVFYAWKRAETLTIQTCEQFARALELLKRLSKLPKGEREQRSELSKSITSLLIESRQDMEQAQRYNPNVDALFFTDGETKHFDKIIETIQSDTISSSGYSQIQTVIQFAYKRAVGIRFWLEQILETTIARDSFELAEEYKWIAIQLRKERINLIKSRLQEEPYVSMARDVIEEFVKQQQQQQNSAETTRGGTAAAGKPNDPRRPLANGINQAPAKRAINGNRDSGNESESNELDIDYEIRRLLQIKSNSSGKLKSGGGAETALKPISEALTEENSPEMDELMRGRIERRRKNGSNNDNLERSLMEKARLKASSAASKLKIDLDEATKRSLLDEVDRMHSKHKSRLEALKSSSKRSSAGSSLSSAAVKRTTAAQI